MTFACPDCGRGVDLRKGACPHCGIDVTVRGVLRFYWKRVVGATNLRCPNCGVAVPISSKNCPNCPQPMTVDAALDLMVEPRKRRLFAWAANASPETQRRVQRMYLLLSLAVLWGMVLLVEERFPGQWWKHSAIAAIFLSALGLVASLIVPKKTIRAILQGLSATTKLALMANYVCLVLAIRMFTTTWKERAFSLAGIIAATFFGAFFLTEFFWPASERVSELLQGEEEKPTQFKASDPQGRKARIE